MPRSKPVDDYTAFWQGMQSRFPFRAGNILSAKEQDRAWEISQHKTCYPELLTWTRRCIDTGCMFESPWPRENQIVWTRQFLKDFWEEGYRVIFAHKFGEFIKRGLSPEFISVMCYRMGKHPDIDALMCFQNILVQIRYLHTLDTRNPLTARREYPFSDEFIPFFSEEGFFPVYPSYDQALPGKSEYLPVSWMNEKGPPTLVMVSRRNNGTSFAVNPVGL